MALKAKFAAFPVNLVDTHGKDIIVSLNKPSQTCSPAPMSLPASANSGAPGLAKKAAASSQKINVSTVEVPSIC